jgi:hypothetical protein
MTKKISELDPAASYTTGLLEVVQDGVSKQLDLSQTVVEAKKGNRRVELYRNASQTVGNGATVAMQWGGVKQGDGTGVWNGSNNTRLTIPAGYTKCRIRCGMTMEWGTAFKSLILYKNGIGATEAGSLVSGNSFAQYVLQTGTLDVVEGDYFEIYVYTQQSGGTPVGASVHSFFEVELIP